MQKVAQLIVSFVWTATDLQEVATAAPGTGTLVLGALACILQLILVLLDCLAAWKTEKLNKRKEEEERAKRQQAQGQIVGGGAGQEQAQGQLA